MNNISKELREDYLESITNFSNDFFANNNRPRLVEDLWNFYRWSKHYEKRFNIEGLSGVVRFSNHLSVLSKRGVLEYVNCGCGAYGKYKINSKNK